MDLQTNHWILVALLVLVLAAPCLADVSMPPRMPRGLPPVEQPGFWAGLGAAISAFAVGFRKRLASRSGRVGVALVVLTCAVIAVLFAREAPQDVTWSTPAGGAGTAPGVAAATGAAEVPGTTAGAAPAAAGSAPR